MDSKAESPNTMRVLDADIYDTMELVAEAYGGIGADRTHESYIDQIPLCLNGFCEFVTGSSRLFYNSAACTLLKDFDAIGITYMQNNRAVYNRLGFKGREAYSVPAASLRRISWAEWCEELGVVRGPHPLPPAQSDFYT